MPKKTKKKLGKGIHIRITDSIDKRKNILESALLSTNLLQKYEDIKPVRNEKTKQVALFKKIIKETRILFKELEYQELPEVIMPQRESPKKLIKQAEHKLKLEAPISRTKLQQDLTDIRNKLENLKI